MAEPSFGPLDEAEVSIMRMLQDDNLSEADKKGALVEEIQRRLSLATLDDTNEILFYHQGKYVKGAEAKILQELEQIAGHLINNRLRSEVLASIRARTYKAREEFDKAPNILNLANCLLNVETGEATEHSPDFLSISQLPVSYDPKAKCPDFCKFLRETLEPEDIAVIVKMLGYLLLRSSVYEKAFMLCGEGSNGKSTLIKTIATFLGPENGSSVSLQDLSNDRFAKAELYGKMANLFADLPAKKIVDTGDFKMLVSGDPIGAQHKHQKRFTFRNYAKLIFSTNNVPESEDKGQAYLRRWVIVTFNRTFEGDEKDEQLIEKLTTPEELSGILNLAIKGLKKLKDDRGFRDTDLEEIRRQYEMGASRIRSFIQEMCILEAGNDSLAIESSVLRDAYRKYCRAHGSIFFDERKFGEELKALGVVHRQKRAGKVRPYFEFGVALKSSRLNVLDKHTTTLPHIAEIPMEEEVVTDSSKTKRQAEQSLPANKEIVSI
jgi:putative DNA primase/helicase